MKKSHRWRSLAAAALLTVMSCGAAFASPKTELVLAIGGESDIGYDPLLGWGRYGHPLFQSTLLSRDAALATVPDLATDWKLSDDRLTWTFHIRPDARFSNGSQLTAKDVAFSFNQAAKAGGALDLTVLDQATALDDTTVEIRLKKPWVTFTENFYALGIVPAASYGAGYARQPIGSGPYRLVSWTEGEQLIVEQNPDYYGPKSPFQKITFLFVDEDTGLAGAKAGKVDLLAVPAALAGQTPAGFKQVIVPSVDNRGITFPMLPDEGKTNDKGEKLGNAVTSDRAIRRAINLGVDRDAMVAVALEGFGKPAFGPADGLPWSNPDAAFTQDIDAAKAVLDSGGWVPGPDGVRVRNGVRAAFAIHYPASDSTRRMLSEILAEQLRPLGIEAKVTGNSWEAIERVMHSEPVMFGWGSHTPLEVYSLYQSDLGGVDFYNAGYFSNPAVDAHFAAAQGAPSLEASYADWQRAEWDGTTGFGAKGEAGWAWLVNLDHVYFATECLDIGKTQIEPHGHGWPITAMLQQWKWTCK